MNNPAASASRAPEYPNPLARADALEREITDLCAHINAASYRLLQLVAELDDEEPWGAWGLQSCAHWLNWRCGIGMNAAREKVRAVTRIADPENEKELLELARYATAAQVEKLVRAYRGVERQAERERAARQHAARELNYYFDEDGSLVIHARLPAEEGAVVLQALNAAMDARFAEQKEVESDDVTAETLAADDAGRCELDNGQGLALDTVRRITCDGSLLRITEDDAGNPLDIGRKTRAVPPAMQRALRSRDGGCSFPGCTHDRFVDAHHIRHWADGGDTSIDNLVLLCRQHHRLVHEGGFGVERSVDGRIRFSRAKGRFIEEHPQLPATGSVKGLFGPTHRRANRETGQAIDAASWIIPGDTLDYGMAIEGLMREREGKSWYCQTDR